MCECVCLYNSSTTAARSLILYWCKTRAQTTHVLQYTACDLSATTLVYAVYAALFPPLLFCFAVVLFPAVVLFRRCSYLMI